MKTKKTRRRTGKQITDYDNTDSTTVIDADNPLRFEDLGLSLPKNPPTQVISIRLPTMLLNKIKALGSQRDVPYQALIKIFLSKAVERS
jgi:predicted DNA binding CopG/RHH family protein